jgi:hypothetical protein
VRGGLWYPSVLVISLPSGGSHLTNGAAVREIQHPQKEPDIKTNNSTLVFSGVNTFSRGGGCNRGSRSFFPFSAFLFIRFLFFSLIRISLVRSRFLALSFRLFFHRECLSVFRRPLTRTVSPLARLPRPRARPRTQSALRTRCRRYALSPCTARVRGFASTVGTMY